MKHFDDIDNVVKAMKMTREQMKAFKREQLTYLRSLEKQLRNINEDIVNTQDTIRTLNLLLKEKSV